MCVDLLRCISVLFACTELACESDPLSGQGDAADSGHDAGSVDARADAGASDLGDAAKADTHSEDVPAEDASGEDAETRTDGSADGGASAWVPVQTNSGPSGRHSFGFVDDILRDRVLLFAGWDNTRRADLWT